MVDLVRLGEPDAALGAVHLPELSGVLLGDVLRVLGSVFADEGVELAQLGLAVADRGEVLLAGPASIPTAKTVRPGQLRPYPQA